MTYKRNHGHKDANHAEIVEALRKTGAFIIELHGVGKGIADLFAYYGRESVFIEIKCKSGKNRFYRSQIEFLSAFPGHVGFASNFDEALNLVRNPHGFSLSEMEKKELREYLYRNEFKEIGFEKVKEIIGRGK